MVEKQSISAGRPDLSEEFKLEVNQDGPTQEWIVPFDVRSKEEIQAERLAYVKRRVEENRQKLLRITTERARAAATANRQGNLHPFPQAHNLRQFEGLIYSEIPVNKPSTVTTADSLVDTMEGGEDK